VVVCHVGVGVATANYSSAEGWDSPPSEAERSALVTHRSRFFGEAEVERARNRRELRGELGTPSRDPAAPEFFFPMGLDA